MRLIISDDPSGHTWGYLEPGTSAEIESLEQSVAQGEWTIGRGAESILKLRALADRLGYRVAEVHESSPAAPPRQVIVERGATHPRRAVTGTRAAERARDVRPSGAGATDEHAVDGKRPAAAGSPETVIGPVGRPAVPRRPGAGRPRNPALGLCPSSGSQVRHPWRPRTSWTGPFAPDTRSQSCCRSLIPKPGRAPGDEGCPPVPPRIRAWHVVRVFPARRGWPSA
jgi:hypothetical protein